MSENLILEYQAQILQLKAQVLYEQKRNVNNVAQWQERCERLRDELSRLKSVVGEVDIELIDQALEETK